MCTKFHIFILSRPPAEIEPRESHVQNGRAQNPKQKSNSRTRTKTRDKPTHTNILKFEEPTGCLGDQKAAARGQTQSAHDQAHTHLDLKRRTIAPPFPSLLYKH